MAIVCVMCRGDSDSFAPCACAASFAFLGLFTVMNTCHEYNKIAPIELKLMKKYHTYLYVLIEKLLLSSVVLQAEMTSLLTRDFLIDRLWPRTQACDHGRRFVEKQ
jgi:hypothetical protein